MIIKIKGVIIAIHVLMTSCNSRPNEASNAKNVVIIGDSIDLYTTYPDLFRYLPDTVFELSNRNGSQNLGAKQEIFDSILNGLEKADTSLYNYLMIRNARLIFTDYSNIYRYKYLKTKMDETKIIWMGKYSPYDRHVSVEKWLALFNSYPIKTKTSRNGAEIKTKLERYLFKVNLGKSLKIFINQMYTDRKLPKSKYYILVLGASWCKPCVEDERILKYWYPKIDSSIVNFLGISMDTDIAKWERYVKHEKFPWETRIAPNSFEDKFVKSLGIESIPMNFLLDEDYKVLVQNTDIRKVLMGIKELPLQY